MMRPKKLFPEFGLMIGISLIDTNFEAVGGIFQTGTGLDVGGAEVPIRSRIALMGCTREGCGNTGTPGNGDPFNLGSTTDLFILGRYDEHLPYGEDTFPYIPETCTVSSTTPATFILNGGASRSPNTINAPRIVKKSIAPSDSITINLENAFGFYDQDFAIKTEMYFTGGLYGYHEAIHNGRVSGATTSTVITNSTGGNAIVAFTSGTGTQSLSTTVTNNTAFPMDIVFIVCNLSGLNIITQGTDG